MIGSVENIISSPRGAFMKHYRVYKLSDSDGRIVAGKDVLAPDDEEAMEKADRDEDCPVCEVWQGTKKVGSIT